MKLTRPLRGVVFLDRDGVINRDSPDYIKTWEEFAFLPRSLEALALLSAAGRPVIVITNQSAVGRGLTTPDHLADIHRRLGQAVADAGGRILDIFFCPHHPKVRCTCRKPQPGLIVQACEKYGIDLASAVFVGDSEKDIRCAKNAGCAQSVLVLTGNGAAARDRLTGAGIHPDHIADDLLSSARWILRQPTTPD